MRRGQVGAVSVKTGPGPLRVVERRYGTLLRLRAEGNRATDAALGLLGLLETELDAEVEDMSWKRALEAGMPVLVQLESLRVELTTDGNGIEVGRATGSEREFEELCDFICEHEGTSSL